ncbi:hypothetical protein T492DRAFT_1142489 [Pavlovales sp. CCMP2436]|nr:hypothetical protein T492DRAFT_1142489 [Pavlovales sp. CCMP2436]
MGEGKVVKTTTTSGTGLVWGPAVVLAAALYGAHGAREFVYDDRYAIVENPLVTGRFPDAQAWWRELWRRDFWGGLLDSPTSHKSFRPVVTASLRLGVWLHGEQPRPLYLLNAGLHCAAVALVAVLIARLSSAGRSDGAPAMAAMWFAAHPVHVEAVCNIVNRAELLAACFALAYLLVLADVLGGRRGGRGGLPSLAGACLRLCVLLPLLGTLAALSKETGATVGLVGLALQALVLCEGLRTARARGGRWALTHALAAVAQLGWLCAFLGWRRSLHATMPVFHPAHNPASHLPTVRARVANYAFTAAYLLWLLLWPSRPCPDYSAGSLPLLTRVSTLDLLAGAGEGARSAGVLSGANHANDNGEEALLLLGAAALTHAAWLGALAYSAGCCAAQCFARLRGPVEPTGHAHPPEPEGPLLASQCSQVAFALVLLIAPLMPAWNAVHPVGFVVAERVLYMPSVGLCALVAAAYARGLRAAARRTRALTRLAGVASLVLCACEATRQMPAWAFAEALWASARDNCPRARAGVQNVVVASNAAFYLDALADGAAADEAIARLRLAVEWEPRYTPLHTNLCMLLGRRQMWAEATPTCRQAVLLEQDNAIAHVNLAAALWFTGERDAALQHAQRAVTLAPDDPRTVGQLQALSAASARG